MQTVETNHDIKEWCIQRGKWYSFFAFLLVNRIKVIDLVMKHDTLFQYIRYNTIMKYHSLVSMILKKVTNEWHQTCPIQI
jgi:hypothetical protein